MTQPRRTPPSLLLAAISVAGLSVLVSGLMPTALADSPSEVEQAQAHVDKGDAHFDRREFDQAIAEYTAALVLRSHPDLLWNIARAHEESGRTAEAIALLQRYVGMARNDGDRAAALDRIARLEGQVGNAAAALVRGRLVVHTREGAWVTVGGARVGQGPEATIAVKPGRYRVQVEAEGFEAAERVVAVGAQGESVVELPLTPVAAPQNPTPALAPTRSSVEGRYVIFARPGRTRLELQGARLVLDSAANGSLEVDHKRPLESWRRGHCGGATELGWTARYEASVGSRLVLSGGSVERCSCAAFCPGADDVVVKLEPLAGLMGWLGEELLIVRPEDHDSARPVPPESLQLSGRWRVDQWDAHPEARELELEADGAGSLTVERAGEVLSWQRRRCAGASTWRQAVRYVARAQREGGKVRLRFEQPEEIACSCSEACTRPGPLRELSVEELGITGYLAAPTGARLHRLP